MGTHKLLVLPIATMMMMTAVGCDEDENRRLVEMAEKHLQRQAEQNREMTQLQHEVAEGSRRLVVADAHAREQIVALHRDVQAERSEIGRQRDLLEGERRDFAAKRRLDPIIAAAITSIGLLAVCLLPLVLCAYLLHRPIERADDEVVAEVLLNDLVANDPLLLPRVEDQREIGFRTGGDVRRLPAGPEDADQTA